MYCTCLLSVRYGGHNLSTRWRSWLRHCATSRRVAGSIPNGVFGTFHLLNPSCRAMALRSTRSLIEMSTRVTALWLKMSGAQG